MISICRLIVDTPCLSSCRRGTITTITTTTPGGAAVAVGVVETPEGRVEQIEVGEGGAPPVEETVVTGMEVQQPAATVAMAVSGMAVASTDCIDEPKYMLDDV